MPTKTYPDAEPVSLDDLRRELSSGDLVVLDALTPQEYDLAHIPGARNLPAWRARRLAAVYAPSKTTNIVVYGRDSYCEAARMLVERLHKLGYTNVGLLAGGKSQWWRFPLPLVSTADNDQAATSADHAAPSTTTVPAPSRWPEARHTSAPARRAISATTHTEAAFVTFSQPSHREGRT